ncbi:MAG TPA: Ig-like domain-containing protein [Gemmatimonadales bacterium]|nr:Ig-like domain-containing protein [Gemmatimonadales bacterium]
MVGFAAVACGGDDPTDPDSESVATISVTPPVARIAPGGSVQLRASIEDGAGTGLTREDVAWLSRDANVASVSESGLVSGLSDGETIVTASADGKSGSATVTVRTTVESIELAPATAEIEVSESLELVAITRDKDGNVLTGRRIAWSSSDDRVATVSQAGVVAGIAAGAARITAMTEGEKGSARISVTAVE